MLLGLGEGQEKMSKSVVDSAIFMEDSAKEVEAKIKKAFCPMGTVEKNPVMDYFEHVVFPWTSAVFISRSTENGGDVEYKNYDLFARDYVAGHLHPKDIKAALSRRINELLQPVRDHFEHNQEAKTLLEHVKTFRITR